MPLEVRELVVKVQVGDAAPPAPGALSPQELSELKRSILEACLTELRRRERAHLER